MRGRRLSPPLLSGSRATRCERNAYQRRLLINDRFTRRDGGGLARSRGPHRRTPGTCFSSCIWTSTSSVGAKIAVRALSNRGTRLAVAVLFVAALVVWLFVRQETAPVAAGVAVEEVARREDRNERSDRPPVISRSEVPQSASVDLVIEGCPASDQPIELLDEDGSYLSGTTSRLAICSPSTYGFCRFQGVGPGWYVVRQGLSMATIAHGVGGYRYLPGVHEVRLDCDRSCSAEVGVVAEDGCAVAGQLAVVSGSGPTLVRHHTQRWRDGDLISFRDLPCGWVDLEATGGTCARQRKRIQVLMEETAVEFTMMPTMSVVWEFRDSETLEPVKGAWLSRPPLMDVGPSDHHGRLVVDTVQPGSTPYTVTAPGYARRTAAGVAHLLENGRVTVELDPTESFEVWCMDGGADCAADTYVATTPPTQRLSENQGEACEPRGSGLWECSGVYADDMLVYAASGRRSTARIPLEDGVQVKFSDPADRACMRLTGDIDPGGACEVFAIHRAGTWRGSVEPRAGEVELPIMASAADPAHVAIRCEASGFVGILAPSEGMCSDAPLRQLARLCIRGAGNCSLLPDSPALGGLLNPGGSFVGCSDAVPAGRYGVVCERLLRNDIELLPGEDHEL